MAVTAHAGPKALCNERVEMGAVDPLAGSLPQSLNNGKRDVNRQSLHNG